LEIGEVVWSGKEQDYLKKSSSTPRLCVLIENVRSIPDFGIFLISCKNNKIKIVLEYEEILA